MRKFLSLFTAMLVAIAVSADPVVLPATLDVNNVSFRSEGMPDFVLAEGDYAGTYFDMGAHDSANDTLLYAQWDVTIEPIMYTVGVVVYNTNSWRVQLDLLNQSDEVVKAIRYKGSSGQCGQYGIGTLDLTDLAAGNYKVRVHAATAWSAMKLKDVIFVANYAGVNVDLPGTLLPAYAELSSGATVSNNAIAFAPSTANNEFATWNVTFAEAGNFDVTIDMTASNGHTYGVALLSADGATEIGAVAEEQAWDTGVKALGSIAVPAAGSYKVKLTNATQWSEALLNSITFAAPAPAHTYTVAGGSEAAFGTAWAPTNAANDMALVEGLYKWEKTEITLAAGTIEFKVCEDHGWDVAYPGSNYQLNIPEAGIYTITITFNADSKEVAAIATKTGDAVVIPTIAMHGNFLGSWADTQNFEIAEGNATASLTLNLAAGNYEFGMRIGGAGNWTSNGVAFTRENASAVVEAGSGNLTLAADVEGDYIFTWTYETNTLAITFPAVTPQPVDEWAEIKFTEPVAAADIAADATFTVAGSEFAMQVTDPDNKMVIDANTARFGTPEAFTDYTHRLKTSGKTNEGVTKNFMTLNIPEAGQLRIAVRTGSNSDATRTLIIKQGETELYNQVVKEDDKTVIVDGENSTNYYPYITVNVVAGSVVLSYPINGLNFYAFAFKAGAAPQPADPTVSVRGTMNEWGETPFELSADKTYATLTIDDIPAGDYQFKMFINGEWRSNGYTFHRGFTGAAGITGNDDNNMVFQADVRGAYTFTWTFANDSLGFVYPEAPQPSTCDWDNIEFLGGPAEYANQFKVCKPENVGVVNIQQPGFATEMGIYMTFPSAAFGEISLPASAYDVQGAGIIFHLTAFTEEYTEVSVEVDGNPIVFTVYNANGGTPQPAHTYTVAGGSDVAFGTTWDPANTANDMEMNDDGIYVWEQTGLTLAAGNIEFKVCEDHAWTVAYPAQNYVLNIPEAGIYNIWVHFDPANGNAVTAEATKTGDAVVIPTIAMHGNFTGSWADTENFTVAEGNATASLTLNLAAGNYEFGMRIGGSGNWTANGAAFSRENKSAVVEAGSGNLTLAADLAGDYVFTWTFETNTLSIAFPIGDGIDNTAVEAKAIKRIVNGQLRIEMNGVIYNAQGQVVK